MSSSRHRVIFFLALLSFDGRLFVFAGFLSVDFDGLVFDFFGTESVF